MEGLEDVAEIQMWKRFQKHNRIKYLFLYFLGFLSGVIILSIIFLVMQ